LKNGKGRTLDARRKDAPIKDDVPVAVFNCRDISGATEGISTEISNPAGVDS
jgi:hypothetical protein